MDICLIGFLKMRQKYLTVVKDTNFANDSHRSNKKNATPKRRCKNEQQRKLT